MKLENMNNKFPVMPEEMRNMVEQEVQRQLKRKSIEDAGQSRRNAVSARSGRRSMRKTFVAAAAAVLAMGTTVFAGGKIYEMYMEKQGNYGLKTVASLGAGETAENTEQAGEADAAAASLDVKAVDVTLSYLPEGMVRRGDDENKYTFEDQPYVGGISLFGFKLAPDDTFEMMDEKVLNSEEITVGDHEGIYLERQVLESQRIWFDKILYVFYPEYSRVVQMYVGQNVDKEEALKIAEGIVLEPAENAEDGDIFMDWSEYVGIQEELQSTDEEIEQTESAEEIKQTASAEEMQNQHKIGESFPLKVMAAGADGEWTEKDEAVTACVSEIKVADDLSLLDENYLPVEWANALDENGKLVSNEIQFVKTGDGIDTIDEVLDTETVAQKLVYATVEYTNVGEETLSELLFFGSFAGITETESGYQIYDRAQSESGDWDTVIGKSVANMGEMVYYDVHGGSRSNNYIENIAPGETVTVHMAVIVNEDELDKMYLNLSGSGSYEFSETSLSNGYVDIRQ